MEAGLSECVTFKIEHKVDISSDEASAIYAAVTNAMLNGEFMNEDSPLHIRLNRGVASIAYIDHTCDVIGYHPISEAVSELMLFDETLVEGDHEPAIQEADLIAAAFEAEAKRIRQRISELRA